jgi:hypothetical protein
MHNIFSHVKHHPFLNCLNHFRNAGGDLVGVFNGINFQDDDENNKEEKQPENIFQTQP